MEYNFKNKVAIVTGSSSGIGEAIAVELTSHGAEVVIVGRREHKLKEVSARCELNGIKPLVIKADVTVEEDIKMIVDKTIAHYGKLDVLVNCAGIARNFSLFADNAMEVFDEVMSTNLHSAVHLVHLCSPHLIATKGTIINIGSIGGDAVIMPNNFGYGASKAALHHFSKCIALDLASKNVRVNVIVPGPVRTDFADTMDKTDEEKEQFLKKLSQGTALGKMVEVEEIGKLTSFLVSDKARSITGSSFSIDNGMLLKGIV